MKTVKKKAILLLTISSLFLLAAGCSKDNSQNQSAQTGNENNPVTADSTAKDASTINGQVTAVDGNTITLTAWPSGGNRGPGNGKNRGQRPNSDSKNSDNITPPDKSSDANSSGSTDNNKNSNRPAPSGNTQKGSTKMPQGEEKTITVTDSTTYSVEKDGKTTTGSITDVTAGSMISVEFTTDSSGNEVPSVITIRSFSRDGMGRSSSNSDSQAGVSNTK